MPVSQSADTYPAPTNLTRTEPDDGTLQISWDGYNEVTNYRIYYSLSPNVSSTASYRRESPALQVLTPSLILITLCVITLESPQSMWQE